jgi:hypothetical protein
MGDAGGRNGVLTMKALLAHSFKNSHSANLSWYKITNYVAMVTYNGYIPIGTLGS